MDTQTLDPQIRAVLEPKVAAGISWLDTHDPGWPGRIDLDRLDLSGPSSCVLGQLESRHSGDGYDGYVERYHPSVRECGFLLDTTDVLRLLPPLPPEAYEDNVRRHIFLTGYPVLTQIWKERITALRAAT